MAPKYRILHLPLGVRYAVSAAAYLSGKGGEGYCLLEEVAETLRLPRAFLAKVLQRLSARGLLQSRRGARGGYRLARPASEVSLADVVAAVGEPAAEGSHCAIEARDCDPDLPCLLHDPMARAEAHLWRLLERERLSQFNKRGRART